MRFLLFGLFLFPSSIFASDISPCLDNDFEKVFFDLNLDKIYCQRVPKLVPGKEVILAVGRQKGGHLLYLRIAKSESPSFDILNMKTPIGDFRLLNLVYRGQPNLVVIADLNGDKTLDFALTPAFLPESAQFIARTYSTERKAFVPLTFYNIFDRPISPDPIAFDEGRIEITDRGCLILPMVDIQEGAKRVYTEKIRLQASCR